MKSLTRSKGLINAFNAAERAKIHPFASEDSSLRQTDQQIAAIAKTSTPRPTTMAKTRSSRPVTLSNPSSVPLASPDQSSKRIPEDVGCVLACRDSQSNNEYEYLVEWKGSAPQERSWETESRFYNHKRIVQYYHIGYPYVTNTSYESKASTPSKQVWFSEDAHRILSSRRMGPDEDPQYLVSSDSEQASWYTSEELSSTEALAAIWGFIGRSKLWKMPLRNMSVRQLHAFHHPGAFLSPCIDCSEERLMCDGKLPCQRCKMMGRDSDCAYKSASHDEPAWPRPPPMQMDFIGELVNTQTLSSTHRIESAINWAALKRIPQRCPPQYITQLKKEGVFWMTTNVEHNLAAMSSEDKRRMREHMAQDKRILPILTERQIDPISFFVRYEVKREWQAREAKKTLTATGNYSSNVIKSELHKIEQH